jgi:predicted SnoaL-like aldol condensation-catalyzing enzyme
MNLEENKKNAIAFYKMAYEGNPRQAVDFFRFDENGKVCEHWDAIQQIPKE